MPYKAIIFDLYGTLVGNFSRKGYDRVQERMAKILDVPYPKLWQVMGETRKDRAIGNLSVEDTLLEICRRSGVNADRAHIEQAITLNREFTKNSIIPEPEVIETLAHLKQGGFHIGLITNCNANVPLLFSESPLAEFIDVPVFSCEERIKKPSHRIYEIACERLKVHPHACLYVGDGSDKELTSAAAVGMRPIRKRVELTDVYDPHRPEVENWQGIAIDKISEVCTLVSELTKFDGDLSTR